MHQRYDVLFTPCIHQPDTCIYVVADVGLTNNSDKCVRPTFHSSAHNDLYVLTAGLNISIRVLRVLGHFTFWISLSPSPKFGLRPKISRKVESFSFGLSHSLRLNFGLSDC